MQGGLFRERTSFTLFENCHLEVGGFVCVLGVAKSDPPGRIWIHCSESHPHDLSFNQWRNLSLFPRRVYFGIFDPVRTQAQAE